jgi:hypothetical protein
MKVRNDLTAKLKQSYVEMTLKNISVYLEGLLQM